MSRYMISYFGGNPPATPDEGEQRMKAYAEWLDGLGDAAVSPANPLHDVHTIESDGTVSNRSSTLMTGYTIIETESMAAALAVAKACPFLSIGGTIEVAELLVMPDDN
ncbi:hypothetical protein Q4485_13395 [Granulosicoccaceae sp. 1_MG-2023]|nr:hypothetical protein [Granulosicoccaceae sp. 1_MG-2023]